MDFALHTEEEIQKRVDIINNYIETYLREMGISSSKSVELLREAMTYSAMNGGKRFRPLLALLVGELLGGTPDKVLPFAVAVEFIHTYSLIHDDLPCMDNDDIRRGKPTNHKVYGEDFALLAGDALLTESFSLISSAYMDSDFVVGRLVSLLSHAAGIRGMVGGQAIDLKSISKKITLDELSEMHNLKTGALIAVAVEGAAVLAGANIEQLNHLKKFGSRLGLAFQVADDILDHHEADQEGRSFTGHLGLEGAQDFLNSVSTESLESLQAAGGSELLEALVKFNLERKH